MKRSRKYGIWTGSSRKEGRKEKIKEPRTKGQIEGTEEQSEREKETRGSGPMEAKFGEGRQGQLCHPAAEKPRPQLRTPLWLGSMVSSLTTLRTVSVPHWELESSGLRSELTVL